MKDSRSGAASSAEFFLDRNVWAGGEFAKTVSKISVDQRISELL